MRQPAKPFIIERKPSRKLKSETAKVSIWGKLDLKQHDNAPVDRETADAPISDSDEGRR